jgi:hypothetical protein
MEIQAFSQQYRANVEIYSFEDSLRVIDNGHENKLMLWYAQGNHYDLVIAVDEMQRLAFAQSIAFQMIEIAERKRTNLSTDDAMQHVYVNIELNVFLKGSLAHAQAQLAVTYDSAQKKRHKADLAAAEQYAARQFQVRCALH